MYTIQMKNQIRFISLSILIVLLGLGIASCKKYYVLPAAKNTPKKIESDSSITDYKVLILMYHEVVLDTSGDEYDRGLTDFKKDLEFIKSKNYELISFDDLTKLKNGEKTLKSNAIIISFDDGYSSDYELAYPELQQQNMPATFFIVTEWVGRHHRLKWSDVWVMDQFRNSEGQKLFSIESHTSSHPFLINDSINFPSHAAYLNSLDYEIGESKNTIQDVTAQSSMWLALPYGNGAYNPQLIKTAKKFGYSGIRTSEPGAFKVNEANFFALPSFAILAGTSINEIENYFK
jgi:peptidoglycan/xylan/chitin deacetylase (PgdA/CDA1 family)